MYKRRLWVFAILLLISLVVSPLAAPVVRAGSGDDPSICQWSPGPGKLTGKVTLPGGTPQGSIAVRLYSATGRFVNMDLTNGAGDYEITGLPAGDYLAHVQVGGNTGYASQWFNNQGDPAQATPITVPFAGTAVANFELALGTQFAGQVTASDGGPVAGAGVGVYDRFGYEVAGGATDANGQYVTTPGVPSGEYRLHFYPPKGQPYFAEYYPDQPDIAAAQPISVTAPVPVAGLDVTLRRGGQITGRLTHGGTGDPVSAFVLIVGGQAFDFTSTGADGRYASRGLPSGTYTVAFAGYGYPDLYAPDRVAVVNAPQVTANVDSALVPGGQITGTVTDSGGGPAAGATVDAYSDSFHGAWTDVDASGAYTLTGLASGAYTVQFEHDGHVYEYYNDTQSLEDSDPVGVTAPNATTGINAVLAASGAISGTVNAFDSGYPLRDVKVVAVDAAGNSVDDAITDSYGHYYIDDLPTGAYHVYFEPYADGPACGYVPEWFDNQAGPSAATAISVTAPNVTGGVNATLTRGSVLYGQVIDAGTQVPLYYAAVRVFDAAGQQVASGYTNQLGYYFTSPALPSGAYRLHFGDYAEGYIDEYYTDAATLDAAQPVTVTPPADVGGLNAALARGGFIAGRVTAAGSQQGVEDVMVTVYDGASQPVATAYTGTDGSYIVRAGLPTGSYRVGFSLPDNPTEGFAAEAALALEAALADAAQRQPAGPWPEPGFGPRILQRLAAAASAGGYLPLFYNNKLSLSQANVVSVTAPQTTSDINAVLQQGLFLPVIHR